MKTAKRAIDAPGHLGMLSSKAVCRIIGGAMDLAAGRLPPLVRIETTNACNSKCTICRHCNIRRPIRQMEQPLFEQIVHECAAWGCREIHLHNFGEPLLDDRLEDRVRYVKNKGVARVKIFSNGSLLSEPHARGLIDAGLDEIKISVDGANKEEFERIRFPLKFDVVMENVQRLVELRDRAGSNLKIFLTCCSTSDKRGTRRMLPGQIDGLVFGKIHNWTGPDAGTGPRGIRKPWRGCGGRSPSWPTATWPSAASITTGSTCWAISTPARRSATSGRGRPTRRSANSTATPGSATSPSAKNARSRSYDEG